MTFPTIPTVAGSRISYINQTDASATRTFPTLSSLTKNAGDLLIAICVSYQDSATPGYGSWGGGFTEFGDFTTIPGISIGLAYKWSDGTETGTFTVTQASVLGHASLFLLSIPGAHASTPPEAGGYLTGTAAAANSGALNPTGWDVEDTLWITVAGVGETSTAGAWDKITATNPTNYTGIAVVGTAADAVGAIDAAVAFRQLAAASEDPSAFTNDTSNTRWGAVTIAVRPSPGVPLGAGTGAVGWAGSATGVRHPAGAASGGVTWAGSSRGANRGTAAGAVGWAGSAAGQHPPPNTGAATTGAMEWHGTGHVTGSKPSGGTASGAVGWAGAAAGIHRHLGDAAGAVAWVGSASGARASSGAASGAAGWAGSATGARTSAGEASGAVGWAGAADGEKPPDQITYSSWSSEACATTFKVTTGAASGSVGWAGSATGSSPHGGSASGAVGWAGGAAGVRHPAGSASGGVTWAGSSRGANRGTGSGAVSWAGTATGTRASTGAASGAVGWAGQAAGNAPAVGVNDGSATGTITYAGQATGSSPRRGAASGGVGWSGTATGSIPRRGAASGAVVWVGVAFGFKPGVGAKTGSASGAVGWAGAAAGVRRAGGSAHGGLGWSGTVPGATDRTGTAAGTVVWAGVAVGAMPLLANEGTAAGTLVWAGVAVGVLGVPPIIETGPTTDDTYDEGGTTDGSDSPTTLPGTYTSGAGPGHAAGSTTTATGCGVDTMPAYTTT